VALFFWAIKLASLQVLALEHWQIGGLLLGVDCIFVATSFKFLSMADSFDRDWHKTLIEYPGELFMDLHPHACVKVKVNGCLLPLLYVWAGQGSQPHSGVV